MKRKSQMEILGLAILFVLVIFGFLLYVMFNSGEKDNYKEDYLQPKMASAILNSMLKTSILCDEGVVYSMTDLIKDCAAYRRISCPALDSNDPPGSCDILEDNNYGLPYLLSQTMNVYMMPYWMRASLNGEEPFLRYEAQLTESSPKCTESSPQREPAYQPFEISKGTLEVAFGICRE